MAVFDNTFFEERVEQLFDLAELVEKIFSSAGLEYRIVGGLAANQTMGEFKPGRPARRRRYKPTQYRTAEALASGAHNARK